MSTLVVEVSDTLRQRLEELAAREGVSVNEIVSTSLTEKISAMFSEEYFDARAKRGNRAKYLEALSKVANAPIDERDEPFH